MKALRLLLQILILSISLYCTSLSFDYLMQYLHSDLDNVFRIALILTTVSSTITLFMFAYFIWYLLNKL